MQNTLNVARSAFRETEAGALKLVKRSKQETIGGTCLMVVVVLVMAVVMAVIRSLVVVAVVMSLVLVVVVMVVPVVMAVVMKT